MDRLDVRSIQAAARIKYLTYYYCWIEFSPRYKCSTAELFAAYTALGYRPQAATIPSAAHALPSPIRGSEQSEVTYQWVIPSGYIFGYLPSICCEDDVMRR